MELLSFLGSYGTSLSTKARVLTAQFGDGYKQILGDGINNIEDKYSINFKLSTDNENAIVAFFKRHKGYIPFKWFDPIRQEELVFTCTDWKITYSTYDYNIVRATFEEVL